MTLIAGCRLAWGVTFVSLACIGEASAQTPDPMARATQAAEQLQIKEHQQDNQNTTRRIQIDPSGRAPYALAQPTITLQATRDSSQAVAVIGVSNPFWSWKTTFATPIAKGADPDDDTTLLTNSGLGNQSTVDFAVTNLHAFRNASNIDDLRLAFCKDHGIDDHQCSDQAIGDKNLRDQFLHYGTYAHPTMFTAHVKVGGKSFEYVDTGTTTKQKQNNTSVAAGVAYGWLLLKQSSAFVVSLDGSRDYTAAKDTTSLCQPITTDVPGTLRCDTRTIGAPKSSTAGTFTADLRHVFRDPLVGLSLQFIVQAAEHGDTSWGVQAPVYFLQSKPEEKKPIALTGGASAGWDSKSGFVAQVFIGTAFSLFGADVVK